MHPRDAAIVATRVVALVIAIVVLTVLVGILFAGPGLPGVVVAIMVALATMAGLLWFRAEPFAAHISRGTAEPIGGRTWPVQTAQAVAFSIVGVVTLASAIPELILIISIDRGFGEVAGGWFGDTVVVPAIAKLLIGLYLTLGSQGLARRLAKRYPDDRPLGPGS